MLTVLVAIGCAGVIALVAGIAFGELLDGVFDAMAGDWGTGVAASAGAALAAFGFGGALALTATALPVAGVLAAGGAGAVVVGAASYKAARMMLGEPTQPHRTRSLHGVFGTVVTPVPQEGFGEVALVHNNERRKINAKADVPLPVGTAVYVMEVLSETAVAVAPATPVLPEPKENA